MLQGGKVVSYASKSLTDTEKRYSQTERENLAIVWAIEHWHIYLFGHKFTVVTDAKALENIYKNPKSKPPARLERWRMRLQAYDFDVNVWITMCITGFEDISIVTNHLLWKYGKVVHY